MNCSFCLHSRFPQGAPQSCAGGCSPVACQRCRQKRFRFRRITTRVAEPVGASWQELNDTLDEASTGTSPLLVSDPAQDLVATECEAFVRICVGNHWWSLRLNTGSWVGGRRDAWLKVVSGEAIVTKIAFYRDRTDRSRTPGPLPNSQGPVGLLCRMILWLRSEHWQEEARAKCPVDLNHAIELMDINHLRVAIRANRITFPAQIPTFRGSYRPDLQCKVVQLYFLMGWSFPRIADKYRLGRYEARRILNEWKQRAARARYVQHIPAAELDSANETDARFENLRLVSGLRAGDRNAYERVLSDFRSPVYNLAYRLLGERIDAERVAEQAFRKLFRNTASLDGSTSLRTLLYRSVVDESFTSRDVPYRVRAESGAVMPIERALRVLHPALRSVLVLKEVEDMTYVDIAEVLRISVSAVKSRLAKGREALVHATLSPRESFVWNTPPSSIMVPSPTIESQVFAKTNAHSHLT